ncbi:GNAT family N-acetyltransferase [Paenibacillus silvisoli]|uniref:GNAT family N-acetyltransferase n=1 Tax=Paenibacillus silvisoli TaxID=3110539 RepID=UPI0028061528|nr:GNAT family N-acetyltransferase [Paenibacillus silvisoli]
METEVVIRRIHPEDYERAHAFQCEYLDPESFENFNERLANHHDLYFAAYVADELIGVCYGNPSRRNETLINLQGIAVTHEEGKQLLRTGIGSRLIAQFEDAVRSKGYRSIGLGSAEDLKVERFYVKNGYLPIELVAKGPQHQEYERVPVADYEAGKELQQELRRRHDASEVIFIFEKTL